MCWFVRTCRLPVETRLVWCYYVFPCVCLSVFVCLRVSPCVLLKCGCGSVRVSPRGCLRLRMRDRTEQAPPRRGDKQQETSEHRPSHAQHMLPNA